MQQPLSRYLQFLLMGSLLVILSAATITYTNSVNAAAPSRSATQTVGNPQSYLKINKQGIVIFSPDQVHMYAQIQNVDITNTTGLTIDLYLNSRFLESMLPGGTIGSGFSFPGTDVYTIPNTNPNAQLTVTVKPHVIPNSNLKVNTSGQIVFSPHTLTCIYSPEGVCLTITNTTNKAMNVYINGVFYLTMYPNQVANLGLNSPGTSIFTIPDTNPNAKLTVIGK